MQIKQYKSKKTISFDLAQVKLLKSALGGFIDTEINCAGWVHQDYQDLYFQLKDFIGEEK